MSTLEAVLVVVLLAENVGLLIAGYTQFDETGER